MSDDVISVVYCAWKPKGDEANLLVENLHKALTSEVSRLAGKDVTIPYAFEDVSPYELQKYEDKVYVFALGNLAIERCMYDSELPDIKLMVGGQYKREAWDQVQSAAIIISDRLAQIEAPPVTKVVETEEEITVGGIGADIQMTLEEAEHLKKIKDLLGGGKMVITKGDLKIEVE